MAGALTTTQVRVVVEFIVIDLIFADSKKSVIYLMWTVSQTTPLLLSAVSNKLDQSMEVKVR